MGHEFRMPSLGADMEAGTLTEWRVGPGSAIRRGEVVALVETAKGIIDIESFEDGSVEQLLVKVGERVPVGTPLALLAGDAIAATTVSAAPAPTPEVPATSTPAATSARRRASPAARARAAALGIDLSSIRGSGPDGAITLADVEPAQRARPDMRSAIGAALGRSKREIPHYYLQHSVDFGPARVWLEDYNAIRAVPERLLPAALLIRAVAVAAARRPGFSGFYREARFEASASVHVGVAIAIRGGGLVAPAILDADRKPIAQVMSELQQLVTRVRTGHMRSGELSSGTITVTILGEEGIESLLPIIYPPQVAIVGFGSVLERPWVVAGQVTARPVMRISLAADHRVTDGRQGAQFLSLVGDLLARPEQP
jgi:pyruvate dehydrogenase E2 component (dihydrolipoamide acetyltransferase)